MKHLKPYKLFESVSDIINETEDILTEIMHLGYEVTTYDNSHKDSHEVKFFIERADADSLSYSSDKDKIKISQEFVDCLQHLMSCLNEKELTSSICSHSNGSYEIKQYKTSEELETLTDKLIDYMVVTIRVSNLSESKEFIDDDLIIESALNESIVYFSPKMREHLVRTNNNISKRLLDLEGKDISNVDVTFIDSDRDGNVTFITMPNAMKMIKAKYPDATNTDLDVSGDKQVADYVFLNDMISLSHGGTDGDTGVYIKSRNTIKIGKLVNKLFKGTLSNAEVEKFVNDFKSSTSSSQEKIELVTGDDIKYWYDCKNYQLVKGTLGNSCMANKDGSFFNLYAENPDSCSLLIMTVDDKLVARALVWKLNSIKDLRFSVTEHDFDDSRPEYFLDRVYSIEDYQVEKMRRFALDKNWAIRKWNSGHQYETIFWKDINKSYTVSMSVKVKKSNYDNTFPYMDTFIRYDHFNGLLWNDGKRRKGGHILQSTQGGYKESIPKRQVYINRFKDFFKRD